MSLFILSNDIVTPNPETLLIEPFKTMWEMDDSPRKEKALDWFTYVDFMENTSKSNPFFGYTIREEREAALQEFFKRDIKAENPELITQAMEAYVENMNRLPSMRFYQASLIAANKLGTFFIDFDMNARNARTGNPLYKPAEITRALKETAEIIKALQALGKQVAQELAESNKGKGGREINHFEKAL